MYIRDVPMPFIRPPEAFNIDKLLSEQEVNEKLIVLFMFQMVQSTGAEQEGIQVSIPDFYCSAFELNIPLVRALM